MTSLPDSYADTSALGAQLMDQLESQDFLDCIGQLSAVLELYALSTEKRNG